MRCTEPAEVSSFENKQWANKNSRLNKNRIQF